MPAFRHKYIFPVLLGIAVGCQPGPTDSMRGGTSNGGESSESISASDSSAEDPFYAHSHPWVSRSTAADADNVVIEQRQLPLAQEPHNVQITRFVEHLASKGFQLQYDVERREWRTTEPIAGEYLIRFNIGAFPPDSTLQEMQLSLLAINLAFGLNPDAHLAMSDPGLARLAPSVNDRRDLLDALDSKKFQHARDTLKREFLKYRLSSGK